MTCGALVCCRPRGAKTTTEPNHPLYQSELQVLRLIMCGIDFKGLFGFDSQSVIMLVGLSN